MATVEPGKMRVYLRTLEADLADRADQLWRMVQQIHERQTRPDKDRGGLSHCLQVEENVWQLIRAAPRAERFLPVEYFLLSVAACCHDFDKGLKSALPGTFAHGEGTEQFLMEHGDQLGLERPECTAVECIVRVHPRLGEDFTTELGRLPDAERFPVRANITVDLRRLCVLFKAADVLHTDSSRVALLAMDPSRLSDLEKAKFLARGCIYPWYVEGNRVILPAYPRNFEEEAAAQHAFGYLHENEWRPLIPELRASRFPHDLETRINTQYLARSKSTARAADAGPPGMDHYQRADASLLGGREHDVEALKRLVLTHPCCALLGPSGVGKSSVLHAGLVPSMEQYQGWRMLITRPDRDSGRFFTPSSFAEILRRDPGVAESLDTLCDAALCQCGHLLVVLDQFEDVGYFAPFEPRPVADEILAAINRRENLHMLLAYRDDVSSLIGPLESLLTGSACGLPRHYLQRLDRAGAEESLGRLLGALRLQLEPPEFLGRLLDDLVAASQKETVGTSVAVYPPYVQMAVQWLCDLSKDGLVKLEDYLLLASGGKAPMDSVILDYLHRNVGKLVGKGFRPDEAERVLVALAHTSGRKARADKPRIAAESGVSEQTLDRLLPDMMSLRLIRRLPTDEWEIAHDLLAKNVIAELISEDERRFKQAREFLDSRARAYDEHHDFLKVYEMKDLWAKRELLLAAGLSAPESSVLLLSMATLDANDIRNAAHIYGDDIEDIRGEFTDPARWSAPGWYWLAAMDRDDLLSLAQAAGKTGQTEGAVAYLRIASLIGSGADIPSLTDLIKGPFSGLRRFAEDTVECVSALAMNADPDMLRVLARDTHPLVRRAAAKAIGYAGTRDDLALLSDLARDEYPHPGAGGDPSVRDAVAAAIGRLGHADGLPILRTLAHGKDRCVLCEVAQAIARIGDPEGLTLLAELATDSQSVPVQHAAARAYADLAAHGDLAHLRELALAQNPIMQKAAAWALEEHGGPEELPRVREMMKSGSAGVRYAALAALARLGGVDDLPALRAMALGGDPSWPVRRMAVRAIGALGTRDDLAILAEIAERNDGVKHLLGPAASYQSWRLAAREDPAILTRNLQMGRIPRTLTLLREVVSTVASQSPPEGTLAAMSELVIEWPPVIARIAAEVIAPRTPEPQLRSFLGASQQKIAPQVLAVFDWRLYAPQYLKGAYRDWQTRQTIPPSCW